MRYELRPSAVTSGPEVCSYLGEVHASFELCQEVQDDALVFLDPPEVRVDVLVRVLHLRAVHDAAPCWQMHATPSMRRVSEPPSK